MSNPDDDARLVRAWLGGDASACDRLLGSHYDGVYRFFEARVPAAAADLTQTTMLACVKGIRSFEGRSTFRTYLYAIARRQLAYYLRQHLRAGASEPSSQLVASMTTPSRLVARKQEQRVLIAALGQLGDDQRTALLLYYWESMSTREIGEVLEVSPTAVSSRLDRARRALAEKMQRIDSTELTTRVLSDLAGWLSSTKVAVGPPRGR